MKKLIGLVMAVFLVAAACSDGDGGGISIASGGDGDSSSEGGSDDVGIDDSSESGSDDSSSEGGSDDGGLSIGGGDWCDFARQVEESNDNLDFESSPAELESALNEFTDFLDEAKGRAPGEISDQVDMAAEAFQDLKGELADADYDFFNLDLSVFNALDTPELLAATDDIDIYNEANCGIPRDSSSTDVGSTDAPSDDAPADDSGDDDFEIPEDGTVRDALVTGFVQSGFTQQEAECLANSISPEDLANAQDPTALLAIFDDCGIGLERLAQLGG